jgi:hypothetical protein
MPLVCRGCKRECPGRCPVGRPRAILCEDCAALRLDARRYRPHPAMRLIAAQPSVSGDAWYRCATCAVQWLRHKQRHELFVVWSLDAGYV